MTLSTAIARLGVLLNSPVPPARPSNPDPGRAYSDVFCGIAIGGAVMIGYYLFKAA